MDLLGGGFKYVLFSPRSLGKGSNLTSIFFKRVETVNWETSPKPSNLVDPKEVVSKPINNPYGVF